MSHLLFTFYTIYWFIKNNIDRYPVSLIDFWTKSENASQKPICTLKFIYFSCLRTLPTSINNIIPFLFLVNYLCYCSINKRSLSVYSFYSTPFSFARFFPSINNEDIDT